MSTDVQPGLTRLRRWIKRHSQATIILQLDENNLNVVRRYLPIPFCALVVNDKKFYDNGEKVVWDERVHKQSHACGVVGAAAEATDADKAATERVVDLPRISPGRGADLRPHAAAPPLRHSSSPRGTRTTRPSLDITKRPLIPTISILINVNKAWLIIWLRLRRDNWVHFINKKRDKDRERTLM